MKFPDIVKLDPAKLFLGLKIGRKQLLARAIEKTGGYRIRRNFYVSREQLGDLIETYRHTSIMPFVPPTRLPPPAKRVSVEEKKIFDRALTELRKEAAADRLK